MRTPFALISTCETTAGATHVRDGANLGRLLNRVLLALVPCVLMALYNTGQQTNAAMEKLGRSAPTGWRDSVLEALGLGYDASSVMDAVVHGLLYLLPVFLVALVTARAWQTVFSRLRRRAPSLGAGVTALLFTLCMPPSIPFWHVVVGMTFGVVIGEEIFGGTGRNLVHPAVAGFVFLYFAYPSPLRDSNSWVPVDGWTGGTALAQAAQDGPAAFDAAGLDWLDTFMGRMASAPGETSVLACLLGAAVLLQARIVSWRILAGGLIGLVAVSAAFQLADGARMPLASVPWYWHVTLGGFAFGLVFFATDPVTAAITNTGRWIHGFLVGALTVLIRVANPTHVEGIMLAVLLGNVFAPLVDYAVMWNDIRRRERRHAS